MKVLFNSIMLLAVAAAALSCAGGSGHGLPPEISLDGHRLKVIASDNARHTVHLSYLSNPFHEDLFTNELEIDLLDILKKDEEGRMNIAYNYAKDGHLPFKLRVDNKVDTTLNLTVYTLYQSDSLFCFLTSGDCLPVRKRSENNDTEIAAKKWLYQSGLHLDDFQIWTMKNMVETLSGTGLREYAAEFDAIMPVKKSLEGQQFSFSTNLKADHYYLVATSVSRKDTISDALIIRTDQIEEYMAEEVAKSFPNSSISTNNLKCHVVNTPRSAMLMLIGVNNDWSKTVIPVGLVKMDYHAPVKGNYRLDSTYEYYDGTFYTAEEYNIGVYFPEKSPATIGSYTVSSGHFQGYSPYSVPLTLTFSGDISTIKVNGKSYDVTGKQSPYKITQSMSLNTGDNNIPIEATDRRGNTSTDYLYISMSTIRD